MKLTEVRRNAFAMSLNDPAYPPGPCKFYNRDFMLGPGGRRVASAVPLAPTTWVALCIWSTTTTSRSSQKNWRRARSTTTIK